MSIDPVPITYKVRVHKAIKRVLFRVQNDSLVLGADQVPANPLDCFCMGLFGVRGETCTLMHLVAQIQTSGLLKKVELANHTAILPIFLEWVTIDITP